MRMVTYSPSSADMLYSVSEPSMASQPRAVAASSKRRAACAGPTKHTGLLRPRSLAARRCRPPVRRGCSEGRHALASAMSSARKMPIAISTLTCAAHG